MGRVKAIFGEDFRNYITNEIPIATDLSFINYPTYIVLKKNPYDPSLLGLVPGRNLHAIKTLIHVHIASYRDLP